MAFDPKPHLIQLPRKVKDRATGQWTTRQDDYLQVCHRVQWFRECYPHGCITTEALSLDWEKGVAIYKATVADGEGGIATGTGTETRKGFEDFVEKAETRSIGRALALLGFGTQFVGEELSEGEHVADAPVRITTVPQAKAHPHGEPGIADITPVIPANGHPAGTTVDGPERSPTGELVPTNGTAVPRPAVIPPDGDLPTRIPAGLQLPCADALIVDLRPPQLSLLIGKVGLKALADKRLEPLHVALLAERASRLDRGHKKNLPQPAGGGLAPEGEADVP
jgi:hypothetical protein